MARRTVRRPATSSTDARRSSKTPGSSGATRSSGARRLPGAKGAAVATSLTDDAASCPCGLGLPFGECCAPALRGHAPATAEALMRSRYCAFVLDDAAYVLASWHPDTRPADVQPDTDLRWTRLEVIAASGGGLFDAEGVVEFRAHYRDRGHPGDMHERSRFVRHDGAWVYWGPILAGREPAGG